MKYPNPLHKILSILIILSHLTAGSATALIACDGDCCNESGAAIKGRRPVLLENSENYPEIECCKNQLLSADDHNIRDANQFNIVFCDEGATCSCCGSEMAENMEKNTPMLSILPGQDHNRYLLVPNEDYISLSRPDISIVCISRLSPPDVTATLHLYIQLQSFLI